MNVPLVSLVFLKRSLVFPILLFSSISLHWLLKKAFLSLLLILWNSAFRCLYLSFSPLLFASLLFTAICKASPDSHFAFLHFFFMGMVLIPVWLEPLNFSVCSLPSFREETGAGNGINHWSHICEEVSIKIPTVGASESTRLVKSSTLGEWRTPGPWGQKLWYWGPSQTSPYVSLHQAVHLYLLS